MSDTEETKEVRKTRSGRTLRTHASPQKKVKPGPASRKLKKKVVVVELEVTDEEDNDEVAYDEPREKKAKLDDDVQEEKLLQSEEETFSQEIESETNERKDNEMENNLVLNDIEMLEEDLLNTDENVSAETQSVNKNEENGASTETISDNCNETDSQGYADNSNGLRVRNINNLIENSNLENDDLNEMEQIEDVEELKEGKSIEDPIITDITETEEQLESAKLEDNKKSTEKDNALTLSNTVEKDESIEKGKEQNGDPEAENISDEELPSVPVAKVPEAEEVSDEELPGPKRAELPADTEVVSEDELPTSKKEDDGLKIETKKRKVSDGDYDPTSPTSENETPPKRMSVDKDDKSKESNEFDFAKPTKTKKLPELDKYWKAVNDDPTDFTGWTYLLQYVDQENDMEAAREAYDAFLSHYPYCYGYWRKYADYEKRKGNKKKCEEVFERGLKAIPLSVDLWIHYLTHVKTTRSDDEEYIRSQFERALTACGLEFRSDRLWDSYIKWETEAKRLQRVTAIYDRLLATPTQGYTTHFDNFQEHISSNPPNKVLEVDEFLALRKEVRHMLKHDVSAVENVAENADVPPGDEDSKLISSDEETKCIRERIVSIRRKIHKNTVNAVTARWNFEEGIKRPYFHVKPLERCQLKNWQDYLDYEIEHGDRVRIIVLFERCLIACALYEEFWLKFVHYLECLKDSELQSKIRDVYERACTIHHLKKPNLHLQWAIFEEACSNHNRAAEILVNLEKSVPNVLQVAYRRINLERRRADHEKCAQLFEHYMNNSKNKMISSNISIKYSRFCLKVLKEVSKAQEVLRSAINKDPNNPRLYLQLIDLVLQKEDVTEEEVCTIMDEFLEKETADAEQKVLFAQRKLEYLEDFGSSVQLVQNAQEQYQKLLKISKETSKKKESKSESSASSKKEKITNSSSSQSSSYSNYNYSSSSNQQTYPYSSSQQGQYNYSQYGQGDQYQYQNWQYPQGGYGGYNQWGGYGGGYGY
ncbi:pre-mRNA-processing factor 39 [Cylas formicarius]|uniref:pre-mRNA-processing factor 39 n=1 Tax=Cylas formicarius TaxID=197179 RepID=UPI00295858AF|nr:pre-mRNA-processing factor 39 [Cylas formicarius]